MAVAMLLSGEGFTRDVYVALTEKMFGSYPMPADRAPEGLITHTAGQSEHGWYVYDLWRSREDFDQFFKNMIEPAMHELGSGEGPGPQPQFFEIETLVSTT